MCACYLFFYLSALLAVYTSGRINYIAKSANFGHKSARLVKFVSLGGTDDGEYNGIGFVETS